MMHISVVVLTYFEPYWFTALKAVEEQTRVPDTKVLLADSRFAERLAGLSANELRALSSWNIVFHDPQGHWGNHRNHVQQFIPIGSWVVMLDDDEVVAPTMVETLENFLSLGVHGMSAFLLPRLNTYGELGELPEVDWLTPSGLVYPDLQDRVFLNGSGTRYAGQVHERFDLESRPMPLLAPALTIRHHKTLEMQERSNVLWGSIASPEGTRFYSQCGEDELLASLEVQIGPKLAQTIVELGAGHPEDFSNSRYFLDRGWKGLLVEGNPELVQLLSTFYAENSNVTVVDCLVGSEDVESVEFAISLRHWALSGVGGVSQPEAHDAGQVQMLTTRQRQASSVIRSWLETIGSSEVGILSIDLEGMDTEVLREVIATGMSPQLLVVERLTEADHVAQSELLHGSGYVYVEQRSLSDIWMRSDMAAPLAADPVEAEAGAVVERLRFDDRQPEIRYQHLQHPAERHSALENIYQHYANACGWKDYVTPGTLAIDIGAHSGDTTVVLAALVGPQGAVVAFDPNPTVFETLARNASMNDGYRIFAECLAVSDVEGEACFADHNNLMCNGGLLTGLEAMGGDVVARLTDLNPNTITVQTVRLDSFLEERYPELLVLGVSFIKTDCEGFDGLIVRSLRDFVKKYRPALFVEWFAWFNDDESRALFEAIESVGYVPMDPATGDKALLETRISDLLCLPQM